MLLYIITSAVQAMYNIIFTLYFEVEFVCLFHLQSEKVTPSQPMGRQQVCVHHSTLTQPYPLQLVGSKALNLLPTNCSGYTTQHSSVHVYLVLAVLILA